MISAGILAGGPAGGGGGYTGPLDIMPGAVVAYSQRAMAAAWVSNAITIRRDSDDATQSFATNVSNAIDAAAVSAFIGSVVGVSGISITDGGTGYDDGMTPSTFDVAIVGGTSTVTAMCNVTTNGSGVVSKINSMTVSGRYSAPPSNPAATTGDDGVNHGSGLTLALVFSAGFASVLFDQSGNGKNGVQATALRQPGWVATATNGVPGLSFDVGSGQFMGTESNVTLTGGISTVFAVARVSQSAPNTTTGNICGMNYNDKDGPDGPDWTFRITNTDGATGDGTAGVQGSGDSLNFDTFYNFSVDNGIHFDTYYLVDGSADPTTGTIYINGADQALSSTPGDIGTVSWPLGIGCHDVADATDVGRYTMTGQIAELLIYGELLSAPNRLAVRQNIAAYYGITLA